MIKKNNLIQGRGINDSLIPVTRTENGKLIWKCPYYWKWKNMFNRCYSEKYHIKCPSYIGCSVDPSWWSFVKFSEWMKQQDYENKCLDKDILFSGNKLYSEDTCCFISQHINLLLNTKPSGNLMVGVYIQKNGRFESHCRILKNDKSYLKHLGTYDTEQEAGMVYLKFKSDYIIELAEFEIPKIKAALIKAAKNML